MKPTNRKIKRKLFKNNFLKNLGSCMKLNPHVETTRRMVILSKEHYSKARKEKLDKKRKEPKICGWIFLTLFFFGASTPLWLDCENLTSFIKSFVNI